VLALLLLAGGGASAPAPPMERGDPNDLALVPADAQGFLTIRVADLWKNDLVRRGLKALEDQGVKREQVEELWKQTGLGPEDIERLTFVFADVQKEVAWVVVATSKPYDRKRLLDKLQDARAVRHAGKTYHVGKMAVGGPGGDMALYFAGPRVAVYGSEAGMKHFLAGGGKAGKGPLEGALKLARGKHHLVGAMNVPPDAMRELKQAAGGGGPVKGLEVLFELKSATLVADVGAAVQVELTGHYPSAAKASGARKAVEGVKALLELSLPTVLDQLKMTLPAAQAQAITETITGVLDSFRSEAKGPDLSLKLRVDLKALWGAMPAGKK
jgi:hypothetical protein